ncbi:hypothetical protein [Niabella terrae]
MIYNSRVLRYYVGEKTGLKQNDYRVFYALLMLDRWLTRADLIKIGATYWAGADRSLNALLELGYIDSRLNLKSKKEYRITSAGKTCNKIIVDSADNFYAIFSEAVKAADTAGKMLTRKDVLKTIKLKPVPSLSHPANNPYSKENRARGSLRG